MTVGFVVESWAKAPAITTRCFSPPLSVEKARDARSEVPVAANACVASSRSNGPSMPKFSKCGYLPIRTISSTV